MVALGCNVMTELPFTTPKFWLVLLTLSPIEATPEIASAAAAWASSIRTAAAQVLRRAAGKYVVFMFILNSEIKKN